MPTHKSEDYKITAVKYYLENNTNYTKTCNIFKCTERSCEKFMVRKNPKPYKSGNIIVHGVFKCKICNIVWNRDVNGATNIYKIAKNAINKLERPKYLSRETKIIIDKNKINKKIKVSKKKITKSVVLDDTTKSQFT